ncbi:MAG: amidohydrolase [Ruminococcaceae bacterium]|nr:amidohydrolase [Oscillospiraceae bacterium]
MDIKEKVKLLSETEVVSWHEHVSGILRDRGAPGDRLNVAHCDAQMEVLDTLGIDKIVVSKPLSADKHASPEKCIVANNMVYEATKRYPGRIFGQAFVNPGFIRETLNELDRCVKELGFIGVKLYHQYFMDDPAQFAMIEKCIELDIPILMHCAHIMDPATRKRQPRCSDGFHMANAAKRYPEATFIMGHIGGGGDWKWAIKAIADCPNVYADIGGSVFDRPLIEESVALLGADRLLFATDGMWSSGVGKLLGADISDEDKKTIFSSKAFNKFLKKAGK